MKYTTVKIGGIIVRIAEKTEIKGYTIGIIEIMWPDGTEKWSKKKSDIWIAENNKRMEAICNFLNQDNK